MSQVRPNVLLVVLGGFRVDAVSADGAAAAQTPVLDGLAEDGTVFEQALSPATSALPSMTSILTGRDPYEHGVTGRESEVWSDRTLVRDLDMAGYQTYHLSSRPRRGDRRPGIGGFDVVDQVAGPGHRYFGGGADVRRLAADAASGPEWYATVAKRALASGAPLRSLGNAAAYRLSAGNGIRPSEVRTSEHAARTFDERLGDLARSDEPFFACAELADPRLPYHVPQVFRSDVRPPGCADREEEFAYLRDLVSDRWAVMVGDRTLSAAEREYLRARYRDAATYEDHAVGRLLVALEDRGLAADTLVAVTAAHGEHLGERHGGRTLIGHRTSVGLPALRVPLIVRYPGVFDDGRRDDLVQPHYLAETVRGLAGIDYDPARSLHPSAAGVRRSVALAEDAGVARSRPPEGYAHDRLFTTRRTAVAGDWKLDEIAGDRRFACVDWAANEAREVPDETVPVGVRERLADALEHANGVAVAPSSPVQGGAERRPADLESS